MSANPSKESFARTLIVAVALCLVCSVIVSSAAVVLKEQQVTNALLDKKKNVLVTCCSLSTTAALDTITEQTKHRATATISVRAKDSLLGLADITLGPPFDI